MRHLRHISGPASTVPFTSASSFASLHSLSSVYHIRHSPFRAINNVRYRCQRAPAAAPLGLLPPKSKSQPRLPRLRLQSLYRTCISRDSLRSHHDSVRHHTSAPFRDFAAHMCQLIHLQVRAALRYTATHSLRQVRSVWRHRRSHQRDIVGHSWERCRLLRCARCGNRYGHRRHNSTGQGDLTLRMDAALS